MHKPLSTRELSCRMHDGYQMHDGYNTTDTMHDGYRVLVARDVCGLTLRALGERMGGMDYSAVHMAIRRLEQKLAQNARLNKQAEKIKAKLCNV